MGIDTNCEVLLAAPLRIVIPSKQIIFSNVCEGFPTLIHFDTGVNPRTPTTPDECGKGPLIFEKAFIYSEQLQFPEIPRL